MRAFLDQRGEDYDDCSDFDALVRGAQRGRTVRAHVEGPARESQRGCSPPLLVCDAQTCSFRSPLTTAGRQCLLALQCKRAAECEANTGPAQRPTVAAAEGQGRAGGGDDEVCCAPAALMPAALMPAALMPPAAQACCADMLGTWAGDGSHRPVHAP